MWCACRRSRRRRSRSPRRSRRSAITRRGTATRATPASRCSCARRGSAAPDVFFHPAFDHRAHRIVAATRSSASRTRACTSRTAARTTRRSSRSCARSRRGRASSRRPASTSCCAATSTSRARTSMFIRASAGRSSGRAARSAALIDELFAHVARRCRPARRSRPTIACSTMWWAPWRNMRQRTIGWRLDYIAAHAALVDETVHCATYREVGTSDHAPVIAHLRDAPRVSRCYATRA